MYKASKNRYQTMHYRRCGMSGLQLPAVSLGLWHNFGGINSFGTMRSILKLAFDSGITHFDLANNYGPPPGSAESNFGRILRSDFRSYRDELIVSTKAGYTMWEGPYGDFGSRKYLLASLDQSLKRMRLDYVDIFYSHRPDPDTPMEETMSALHTAVQQGKALYAGISNYNADQTRQATGILRSLGTPCLINQVKYSMLNRWVEEGLLDALEETGTGGIAFSPLAQGLLTGKYLEGIPAGSRVEGPQGFLRKEHLQPEILGKIRKLKSVAEKRQQTLSQLALSWVLRDERMTSVLIGVSNTRQLEDNLRCIDNTVFSAEEVQTIDTILKD